MTTPDRQAKSVPVGDAASMRSTRPPRIDSLLGALLALYVFTLPFDFTSSLFPILRSAHAGPESVSLITAARLVLAMLLLFLPVALESVRGNWPRWDLLIGGAFGVLWVCGAVYTPDRSTALAEILRLGLNIYVMVLTVYAVRQRWVPAVLLGAIRLSMIANGVVIIVSSTTGLAIWRTVLVAGGRPSGTFADPNIAGRYLGIAFIVTLLLPLAVTRSPPMRSALLCMRAAETLVLSAALLATGSRSAIVATAVALVLGIVLALRTYKPVVPALLLGTAAFAGLAGLLSAAGSPLGSRISTLSTGTTALGSRTQLIRAGLAMFLDHPVFGVGTSGFGQSILGHYANYQSYYGSAQTTSHTSLVSLLAEHGVIGLLVFGIAGAAVITSYRSLRRLAWRVDGASATAAVLAVVVIFLSSQAEGSLIEEPLTWVLLGLLIGRAASASTEPTAPLREHF